MNGTSVLATALVYGVGQAPLSLIQPGVITNPLLSPANAYYYNSVVGEDGTAYVLSSTSNTVSSVTSGGVVTVLPITGLQAPLHRHRRSGQPLHRAERLRHGPHHLLGGQRPGDDVCGTAAKLL